MRTSAAHSLHQPTRVLEGASAWPNPAHFTAWLFCALADTVPSLDDPKESLWDPNPRQGSHECQPVLQPGLAPSAPAPAFICTSRYAGLTWGDPLESPIQFPWLVICWCRQVLKGPCSKLSPVPWLWVLLGPLTCVWWWR